MCAAKAESRTKGGVVLPGVGRALAKLGNDINVARRSRRISTTDMAKRMGCSRGTLHRLEAGDAGVSLNTLARALQVLGMLDRLADLVSQSEDDIGMMMTRQSLPQRVTGPRRKQKSATPSDAPPSPYEEDDEPEGW